MPIFVTFLFYIIRISGQNKTRWRFLATFLRPVFSVSRVQQVSDLHLKFAHKATPRVEVWQTSNLRRLRLGEEKKKKKKEEQITA